MSQRYSEDEAIEAVALLTRRQLASFIEAQIVLPLSTDEGRVFRRIDIVRMELLCELSEEFSLDEDALAIVICWRRSRRNRRRCGSGSPTRWPGPGKAFRTRTFCSCGI